MCDHFARELIKVVVVQICQDEGFQGIQASALEALTDLMIKYLDEMGYGTHLYAEASCRTDSNFLDFALALRDCNGSVRELIDYVHQTDEVPFAKPIPPFPIRAATVPLIVTGNEPQDREPTDEEARKPDYVPAYLPPFPKKHTYQFTPTQEESEASPGKIRQMKNKRKRQVESSLAQLEAHRHSHREPLRTEAPEYFAASNTNKFLSSLGLSRPSQVKAQLKARHRKYEQESNPDNEGERPQKILTQEEDGGEARRRQRMEEILQMGGTRDTRPGTTSST